MPVRTRNSRKLLETYVLGVRNRVANPTEVQQQHFSTTPPCGCSLSLCHKSDLRLRVQLLPVFEKKKKETLLKYLTPTFGGNPCGTVQIHRKLSQSATGQCLCKHTPPKFVQWPEGFVVAFHSDCTTKYS